MENKSSILQNNVVLVTGGAGLLGKEFVKGIIMQGGVAIIADINEELGTSVVKNLSNELQTTDIDFVFLDITSKNSINNAIKEVVKKRGRIDGLVNNAYPRNKNYGRHFFDVESEDFNQNINLNLGGYFLVSQQFASYFKSIGGGNIVNISSIYGVMAPRFEVYDDTPMTMPVEYAVIKSGLLHLTKYMAKYFKGENIRVNALSPGGILDSQPEEFLKQYKKFCLNKGMLDPIDMVGTLVFLLSELGQNINGQNIVVDDGFTL